MKVQIFGFVILAIFGSCMCLLDDGSSEEDLSNPRTEYLNLLKNRQKINQLSAQFEQICPSTTPGALQTSVVNAIECFERLKSDKETLCHIIKNDMEECIRPVTEVMEECFPPETKPVPKFLLRGMIQSFGYICKADGEHIFELMNPCARADSFKSSRCLRRLKAQYQSHARKPITVDRVCEVLASMRPCLESHLQSSCGNAITKETVLGVYDAFRGTCTEGSENEVMVVDITNNRDVENFNF